MEANECTNYIKATLMAGTLILLKYFSFVI